MADRQTEHYDAFLAYSHAADGPIANLVARGLEVFAKAWNRARALRVFRDTTSLAASPSLWSALEQALLSSRYLIVLLSPAGARSEWLNREIEFFRQHFGADQILLVITDGELVWDNGTGDFDPQRSSAVPRALFGAFTSEPLWIDLRWAKQQERLTIRDPRLSDALATLAAALRSVTKDELIGEHLRQNRRTRRLVAAAVVTLTLLVLSSLALSVLLVQERPSGVHRSLAGEQFLWIIAVAGGVLLVAAAIRHGWRSVGRFWLRAPPDADDSSTYRGITVASPGPPFPLWDFSGVGCAGDGRSTFTSVQLTPQTMT